MFWWKGNNAVKHGRSEHFVKASLKNVINALSALFVLEMKFLSLLTQEGVKEWDIPNSKSKLFLIPWETRAHSLDEMIYTVVED